ncbi:unnamed protein product [Heterosigma akashiwo]
MASKTYLRYVHSDSFGVIASTGFLSHGALYDPSGTLVFSAALQNVVIWNLRQGSQVGVLCPDGEGALKAQVTTLGISPDTKDIAAGYSDGKIRVWDYAAALKTGAAAKKPGAAPSVTLNGHRAAVLRLAWALAALLASGAQDTAVVVWDLVAEAGSTALRRGRAGGGAGRGGSSSSSPAWGSGCCSLPCGRPRGLVSCGRDALVKVWDLDTQSCCQTVVGHRAEVWGLALHPAGRRLATVAADDQVRVWSMHATDRRAEGGEGSGGGGGGARVLEYMGSVTRSGKARGSSILFHPKGHLLGICSNSKEAEVLEVLKEQERKKAEKRRQDRPPRQRRTGPAAAAALCAPPSSASVCASGEAAAAARRAATSPCASARRSASATKTAELSASAATSCWLSFRSASSPASASASSRALSSSSFPGRKGRGTGWAGLFGCRARSALRLQAADEGLCHSNEGRLNRKYSIVDVSTSWGDVSLYSVGAAQNLVITMSVHDDSNHQVGDDDSMVKVWNVGTRQAVRALPAGAAPLCCAFGPGDRHLLVGAREGGLALYALGSGEPLQEAAAHAGAVWALAARPDGRGFATGGADRLLRFVHTRTLKVEDDVLAVAYSHAREEGKLLLAVATLDSTIRVFHDDSLKFFLSLYGHKLPVMSMDISDDDALLVSGSADKTVKIWGLDFGDCHRSLLAHEDSIMSIKFVRGTHYFFTASKDKTIKYWDADHFEQILVLEGHHAEVWSLAVSNDGSFLISGSHDRSLLGVGAGRTKPVFLEEEREKEMEAMFEEGLGQPDRDEDQAGGDEVPHPSSPSAVRPGGGSEVGAGFSQGPSALASKRTIESVRSGERLMDAIEIAVSEEEAIEEHEKKNKKLDKKGQPRLKDRQPNPLMLGKSPLAYILFTLQQIRPAELEQALLVLSYTFAEPLISFLQVECTP